MKDYYKILGLEEGAGFEQIKKAYRRLAKKYHPDSTHPHRSEARFIEVNEAYEFLSDSGRRASYRARPKISQEEVNRREDVYQQWVYQQQERARKRAQRHSSATFEEFKGSSIFRTAMVVDKVYNYIFVAIGAVMAILPFVILLTRNADQQLEEEAIPLWRMIFPFILGALFTYGIYYFVFKHDPDES